MIGGNITAILQTSTPEVNEIGEGVQVWNDACTLTGFLDLQSGDSKYTTFNAKMQESTHIFICDYIALSASVMPENSRLVVEGRRYDVMLIDDPMGLHRHLEFYLKFTGGQ